MVRNNNCAHDVLTKMERCCVLQTKKGAGNPIFSDFSAVWELAEQHHAENQRRNTPHYDEPHGKRALVVTEADVCVYLMLYGLALVFTVRFGRTSVSCAFDLSYLLF